MRFYLAAACGLLLFCAAPASAQLAPPPGEIDDFDQQPEDATRDAELNAQYDYKEGVQAGIIYGQEKSVSDWQVGGFAAGLLGGPIGAGLVYGLAEQNVPNTTRYRSDLTSAYSRDFYGGWAEGYRDVYDNRRESAALTGGLIGTAAFGAILAFLSLR